MKSRQGCKGYVIEARSNGLKDGGFSAEFSVEDHDSSSVTETGSLVAACARLGQAEIAAQGNPSPTGFFVTFPKLKQAA